MIRAGTAVVVVGLVLSACGSSSSSSSSTSSSSGSSITPAQYRSEVNAVCSKENAEIRALPVNTSQSVAGIIKEEQLASSTLAQVKNIPAPAALQSQVNSWTGTLDQAFGQIEQIVNDLKANKVSDAQALAAKVQSLETQTTTEAKALGLQACTVSAQPSGK